METDADRLELIQALGGQIVRADSGTMCAVFDNAYSGVSLGDLDVEDTGPRLTCRSSDVARLSLRKDSLITVGEKDWRVARPEPDGTGMTILILRE
jgi:hypothetical protein